MEWAMESHAISINFVDSLVLNVLRVTIEEREEIYILLSMC